MIYLYQPYYLSSWHMHLHNLVSSSGGRVQDFQRGGTKRNAGCVVPEKFLVASSTFGHVITIINYYSLHTYAKTDTLNSGHLLLQ